MSSPLASYVPLWINQGDTFIELFTWYQPDGKTPVDLTNATIEFKVQRTPAAGGGTVDWSSNVVLGGVNGTVTLTDAYSLTAGFNVEIFGYFNARINLSNQKTRVWEGDVYVSLGVL